MGARRQRGAEAGPGSGHPQHAPRAPRQSPHHLPRRPQELGHAVAHTSTPTCTLAKARSRSQMPVRPTLKISRRQKPAAASTAASPRTIEMGRGGSNTRRSATPHQQHAMQPQAACGLCHVHWDGQLRLGQHGGCLGAARRPSCYGDCGSRRGVPSGPPRLAARSSRRRVR
jgi:hypothetical protein